MIIIKEITENQIREAWEMYQSGFAKQTIAKKFNFNGHSLFNRIEKQYPREYKDFHHHTKIKQRFIAMKQYDSLEEADFQNILQTFEMGLSIKMISNRFNLNKVVVSRILKENLNQISRSIKLAKGYFYTIDESLNNELED